MPPALSDYDSDGECPSFLLATSTARSASTSAGASYAYTCSARSEAKILQSSCAVKGLTEESESEEDGVVRAEREGTSTVGLAAAKTATATATATPAIPLARPTGAVLRRTLPGESERSKSKSKSTFGVDVSGGVRGGGDEQHEVNTVESDDVVRTLSASNAKSNFDVEFSGIEEEREDGERTVESDDVVTAKRSVSRRKRKAPTLKEKKAVSPKKRLKTASGERKSRRSLLDGLSSDNIIPSEDKPAVQSPPYNTRTKAHGRRLRNELCYDQRYHPLDEYTNPKRAAKMKKKYGRGMPPSDSESDVDTHAVRDRNSRPTTMEPRATRTSLRPTNRPVLYNTNVHPQDRELEELLNCEEEGEDEGDSGVEQDVDQSGDEPYDEEDDGELDVQEWGLPVADPMNGEEEDEEHDVREQETDVADFTKDEEADEQYDGRYEQGYRGRYEQEYHGHDEEEEYGQEDPQYNGVRENTLDPWVDDDAFDYMSDYEDAQTGEKRRRIHYTNGYSMDEAEYWRQKREWEAWQREREEEAYARECEERRLQKEREKEQKEREKEQKEREKEQKERERQEFFAREYERRWRGREQQRIEWERDLEELLRLPFEVRANMPHDPRFSTFDMFTPEERDMMHERKMKEIWDYVKLNAQRRTQVKPEEKEREEKEREEKGREEKEREEKEREEKERQDAEREEPEDQESEEEESEEEEPEDEPDEPAAEPVKAELEGFDWPFESMPPARTIFSDDDDQEERVLALSNMARTKLQEGHNVDTKENDESRCEGWDSREEIRELLQGDDAAAWDRSDGLSDAADDVPLRGRSNSENNVDLEARRAEEEREFWQLVDVVEAGLEGDAEE